MFIPRTPDSKALNKHFLTSLHNLDVGCMLKERNASPEYDKEVRGNPLHITVENSQIT